MTEIFGKSILVQAVNAKSVELARIPVIGSRVKLIDRLIKQPEPLGSVQCYM